MRAPLLCAALLLGACVAEEPAAGSDVLFAPLPGDLPPPGTSENCHDFGCGKNTAAVGPTSFHELHHAAAGRGAVSDFNTDGVRIEGAWDSLGRPMRLVVSGTTLRGILLVAPYTTVSGKHLAGSTIELYDRNVDATYTIHHAGVGTIETWVAPIERIQTHYFRVDEGDGVLRDLCKAVDFAHGDEELGVWPDLHVAIVFSGDRYNRYDKTVTTADTRNWFNIGCAGTVLPKLVLNRLTTATSDAAHTSTVPDRQAALRALTATYCPESGLSYTHDGVPLHYTNVPHWMDFPYDEIPYFEAVWDADGPVCLTEPRLADDYPGILEQIEADCGLPSLCLEEQLDWTEHGYFVTAKEF